MNHDYTIYLDSDGVLADFDQLAYTILGNRRISEVPKGYLWACVEKYDKEVAPFFESLEIMPNAESLVDFCLQNFHKVEILTASGYTPKDGPMQKVKWYARHFPGLKVNVVAKSPDKAKFAGHDCVLVDDRMKSLDPWVAAGGIAIHHVGVSSTIEQLKKLLA